MLRALRNAVAKLFTTKESTMTTQAEKDAIKAKLDEATALVQALPVDPDVNPLQAELDAANAANAALTATNAALQAKIDAAKLAAQADKAADEANVAGQAVLDALA